MGSFSSAYLEDKVPLSPLGQRGKTLWGYLAGVWRVYYHRTTTRRAIEGHKYGYGLCTDTMTGI